MPDVSLSLFIAAMLTFLLAGVVKGVTGMGLPTVAMAVLGALASPLVAASLMIVPSFITNVWQLLAGRSLRPLLHRFWPMLLAIMAGTILGSPLLAGGDAGMTTIMLGAALILYAGHALVARQVDVPQRLEPWLSPVVGLATGLVTGSTGIFVIPAVPYLQALGLGKDDLVQALGLSFTTSTIALAVGLGAHRGLQLESFLLSMLAIAPALAGMWVGQRVRDMISPKAFRRAFLVCLLLLGVEMTLRSQL